MFENRKRALPLPVDLLLGAAAGVLGAWLMSPTMKYLGKLQSEAAKRKEQDGSFDENATIKAARLAAKPLHLRIPEGKEEQIGYGVHFAHGAVWGAAYALARRKVPGFALANGLLLGFGLWLFADEIAVPALGLGPKPDQVPVSSHLKALGGHLAYGAATDGVLRLGRRIAT